ncbi:MAG: response regulator transcription factor [Eubacteriales bacterium]|nr:response regulator transcription factor [Eubacteriales bacterium]MDD3200341.1 response regulator transcription factor [Eubacteriales bacterium]MDD4121727.1 response regulator transcription factor [Eubacteriales bacterium]MDD4630260.1 response regulator transcription factor [Eubacteriales bacterium]
MINLLIADHQPLIRRGIIEVLSVNKEAYEIYEAGTLDSALKISHTKKIDISIVELHLGTSDGLEYIFRAKKLNANKSKYILLASAITIFEFRRAKELEVDGFILKDALIEDFIYAFNVVKRGEKFYQSKIIEKTISGNDSDALGLLTEREMDVFSELQKGLTNCQISRNLFITEGTTKKHISSILNKLRLSNRMEAVVYANKLYQNLL